MHFSHYNIEFLFTQVQNGTINMTIGRVSLEALQSKSTLLTYPNLLIISTFTSPVGYPYTSIERIVMPFSNMVWFCSCIAIVFIIQYLLLCKNIYQTNDSRVQNDNSLVIFEAINSSLGGPLSAKALPALNRSGMTVWLLASLVLRTIYSGALFDLMQAQINERPVDTIERLIESNYKIVCSPFSYDIIYESIPGLRKQWVSKIVHIPYSYFFSQYFTSLDCKLTRPMWVNYQQ